MSTHFADIFFCFFGKFLCNKIVLENSLFCRYNNDPLYNKTPPLCGVAHIGRVVSLYGFLWNYFGSAGLFTD